MMRKYLSLILLIVVLFAGEGWYLSFIYLQHTVREEAEYEIRKGLKDEDLTLIVVTPGREQEITWTKKDREFRYRGSMYDVVRIKVREGKILLLSERCEGKRDHCRFQQITQET